MTQYSGKVIRKTPVTPTQQSASGVWKLNEQAAAIRNNSWPVPGVPDPISRSVRLRSSASAYFNRTPASASNRKTWTWSGWVKRGTLGATNRIFTADDGSASTDQDYNTLFFTSSDQIKFAGNLTDFRTTTAVYRDPSAWYHIVFATDTTQATAANRFKLYVNGVEVTAFGTSNNPSQNTDLAVNAAIAHYIGSISPAGASYFDGYQAEINFIDGQALTPSSFGTTDTATGAWIPIAYTGTYGTNGFYLNFKDNTSTTTLGYDYSGNANNWTANNISLTSGSTYDSMLDVPTPWVGYTTTTDTSAVTRGNYAVLASNAPGIGTISAANLQYTSGTTTVYSAISTISVDSGKWYWEVTATAVNTVNQYPFIGAYRGIPNTLTGAVRPGADTGINGFSLRQDGTFRVDGTNTQTISSFTTNDVFGIALDLTNLEVKFYKNGTLVLTQTGLTAGTYTPADSEYNGSSVAYNFGQRPFSYTPPTGFKTLVTTNLPTPTIANGASYMAATTYTGNGTSQSINNSVNGVSFRPDFVWYKNRSIVASHNLFDSVRGVNQYLISDSTAAEGTASGVTAFNSNGFSVGSLSNGNGNGNAIVAWQWQAGQGTTSSNTSGSITSTVSVSTTSGFSVVTYTGTGANATVGHGLGVAPNMVIVKERNAVRGWPVYHSGLTSATYYVDLQTTAAQASASTIWNSTAPTSTVFSIGTDTGTNQSTGTYVAYCFAAVAGYSAIGSYTGNGSADGTFIYTGFRPRFVMIKRTDGTGIWLMQDTSRGTYNVVTPTLEAQTSNAEFSFAAMDILSNGFKIRLDGANTAVNANGGKYIYAAFAENPFKYSNAR